MPYEFNNSIHSLTTDVLIDLYQLVRHQYPSNDKRLLDDVLGMNFSINTYDAISALLFCECPSDFRLMMNSNVCPPSSGAWSCSHSSNHFVSH